jgi:hypothetical protein
MILATAMAGLAPTAATAQGVVAFEVGASQVGPPSGLDGDNARFGMAGVRASYYGIGGSGIGASLMFGRALGNTNGGDFVSGVLAGAVRSEWSSRWTGGMDLELVGFQVRSPFPYTAVAVEGGPLLSVQTGPLTTTAKGVLGVGSSSIEVWRRLDGIHRIFDESLWRVGAEAELLLGSGAIRGGLAGGVHDSRGGSYTSGGARVLLSSSWVAAEVRADVWDTPLGTEVTGGLSFAVPLSGWSLRGFFGKSEPDPLTLAEPGSGSAGLVVSMNLYSQEPGGDGGLVPYQVLTAGVDAARVRLRLEAPSGTRAVSVLGDFSLWEAIAMRRQGDAWVADVEVPYGTHHYGFLVDDEWYVPSDTQDVVPDEWGRQSAILVIEGAN